MGKAKDAQRVKAKKAANSGSADATPGLQKASAAAKDKVCARMAAAARS
jgi:hypothetical protein